MWPETLLLLIPLLLSGGLLWFEHRQAGTVRHATDQLERSACLLADLRWWQASNERLAQWQALTESSIDGGTRAARALHHGIAAIPFDLLEAIPATRETTRMVRNIHDFTADNIYGAIAALNRLAGQGSRRVTQAGSVRNDTPGRPESTTEGPGRFPADDPGRSDH